jgi:hypothetical protein
MTYWHIGNRRNARATVAITGERGKAIKIINSQVMHLQRNSKRDSTYITK